MNRTYALHMTVYLAISLPLIPFIHRTYMVLVNPMFVSTHLLVARPHIAIAVDANSSDHLSVLAHSKPCR